LTYIDVGVNEPWYLSVDGTVRPARSAVRTDPTGVTGAQIRDATFMLNDPAGEFVKG
jgi:hypothetical protein